MASRKDELLPYMGELVNIHLKTMSVIAEDDGGEKIVIKNIMEGYVIDITDNYIHLGDTTDEMNKSVPLDEVGIIEIMEQVAFFFEGELDGELH